MSSSVRNDELTDKILEICKEFDDNYYNKKIYY